jgi:hypothetical protein
VPTNNTVQTAAAKEQSDAPPVGQEVQPEEAGQGPSEHVVDELEPMETSEAAKEKEPEQIQENITEPTPAEGNFETDSLFCNIKK